MPHLADLFPAAGLAPPVGDALRGPYLRWMAFYAATFEPAVVDRGAAGELTSWFPLWERERRTYRPATFHSA